MNRQDLINEIACELGESKASVARVIDALVHVVQNKVSAGESVHLNGFGVFDRRISASRTLLLPTTKGSHVVPERFTPKFTAGAVFKRLVREGRHDAI